MLEKDIEKILVKKVKDLGGLCEKFVSPSRRSVPDRIITLPGGKVFFVECKAPGKRPTEKQLADHQRRRELHADVWVVDCEDEIESVLHKMQYE